MLLALSTWKEIETYLDSSSFVLIPIGSTEQHGPTGMIGTDAICPATVAQALSEQAGVLVAPTLQYGMAQHHLGFAGSVTLRPTTLIAMIQDVVDSLQQHGFRHVYFLNGHGGNIATISAAFSEFYARSSLTPDSNGSGLHLYQRNWWSGDRVKQFSADNFGEAEGSHATPTEVSLTFHAYPHRENRTPLQPEIAPGGAFRDAVDYRRNFPDGRIGSNPALASTELGAEILGCAVADTLDHIRRVIPGTALPDSSVSG
jgi:creatinine amidohydrolase